MTSISEKDSNDFQTDVRRRTNLLTARNALQSAAEAPNEILELSSAEYLRHTEDEINRIIDRDVETLVEGMEEIIDLSVVKSVDKLRSLQDSLAIELRTETLIRSCTSLMSLSHSMKMMWLLGDESHSGKVQELRFRELDEEINRLKLKATSLIEQLKIKYSDSSGLKKSSSV
ncbi:hypothetical protein BY996DRAFT_7743276 [Phakopsora pachyrhizi]|nr:hypothetical protein BY996DRAFT_7743276 [Phakopsora pachyrhizi]